MSYWDKLPLELTRKIRDMVRPVFADELIEEHDPVYYDVDYCYDCFDVVEDRIDICNVLERMGVDRFPIGEDGLWTRWDCGCDGNDTFRDDTTS